MFVGPDALHTSCHYCQLGGGDGQLVLEESVVEDLSERIRAIRVVVCEVFSILVEHQECHILFFATLRSEP